jgi:hypothetical protein
MNQIKSNQIKASMMLWDVMLQSRSKFLQFGKTIVRILGDEDVLYVCFL